ncbi:MAG: hypothetical protein HY532_00705 [Chloroflexi bacterium]|nr:hypothetical protein [Chloroflexota bacterium]
MQALGKLALWGWGTGILRHPLTKLTLGGVVILMLLLVGYRFGSGLDLGAQSGTISASDAAACGRQGCDVHLTATVGTLAYAERLGIWDDIAPRMSTSQAFVITATAHAGTVRSLALDDKVFLRVEGILYPAAGKPIALTSHHNTYLVFFPRYDMVGHPLFEGRTGQFDLVFKGIEDPQDQRAITFNYGNYGGPAATGEAGIPLVQVLMTIGAAMAALLFACTPCLVGSMTVGSLATGTAVSHTQQEAREKARAMLVRQTLTYMAALVVIYVTVAVAMNLLRLQAEDLRPMEFAGGLALMGVGFVLLRGSSLGMQVEGATRDMLARVLPGVRGRSQQGTAMGPKTSTAMGASLAMVCSVAGAPTLTTAILLPLLVYAGLSHPVWAFLVLLVYLLVCAVPFLLVAVGWGEFLFTVSYRLRNTMLVASAVVLVTLGVLLLVSPSTLASAVATPVRMGLKPLQWLG